MKLESHLRAHLQLQHQSYPKSAFFKHIPPSYGSAGDVDIKYDPGGQHFLLGSASVVDDIVL